MREGRGIAVSFDSGLLFDVDSSNLRTEGYENLQKLANILKKDNETILMIVGHTDSTGDETYNLRLSERRAQSAMTFMQANGLSSSRLQISGRGELEPIGYN